MYVFEWLSKLHLHKFSKFKFQIWLGKNGAKCSPVDGSCTCSKGWNGTYCVDRTCPDHMYGEKCDHSCECDKNNTRSCHPWTGKCDCKAGWSSNLCNRPCPFLTVCMHFILAQIANMLTDFFLFDIVRVRAVGRELCWRVYLQWSSMFTNYRWMYLCAWLSRYKQWSIQTSSINNLNI